MKFRNVIYLLFATVCTVHRNQLYQQPKKMHFLYVFIPRSYSWFQPQDRAVRHVSMVCTELQIQ